MCLSDAAPIEALVLCHTGTAWNVRAAASMDVAASPVVRQPCGVRTGAIKQSFSASYIRSFKDTAVGS